MERRQNCLVILFPLPIFSLKFVPLNNKLEHFEYMPSFIQGVNVVFSLPIPTTVGVPGLASRRNKIEVLCGPKVAKIICLQMLSFVLYILLYPLSPIHLQMVFLTPLSMQCGLYHVQTYFYWPIDV